MMTRKSEIGSEFWDVPITDNNTFVFPENTSWFLSGRSALKTIIDEIEGKHTVAMPSWCCDSMVKPFLEAGFEIHFYPVYFERGLKQEISLDSDVLFLMSYFGYTQPALDLSSYKGIVIRDVTHSIFSAQYNDAHYYFGSLRKWVGVWTGGYAWTKDGHELFAGFTAGFGFTELRQKAMELKSRYIHAQTGTDGIEPTDKSYLTFFSEAEKQLEGVGISPAAQRDVDLARRLDVDYIRKRRKDNAEVLRTAFPEWLIFPEIGNNDCPMFVPVLVPDRKREELRRYLINNDVYCPVHWPVSNLHILNERELFIYRNELSLICDQRYTEDDINRMVEIIKTFMEA